MVPPLATILSAYSSTDWDVDGAHVGYYQQSPATSDVRLTSPPLIPGVSSVPVIIIQYSNGPSHFWNCQSNTLL